MTKVLIVLSVAVSGRIGAADLQGIVTDKLTTMPIDALVCVVDQTEAGIVVRSVRTDAHGLYQVTGIEATKFDVQVHGADHATIVTRDVVLDSGLGEPNFQLDRAAKISGTVVDANESRVQGATVEIVYSSFRPPTLWRTRVAAITDDQGRFLLPYVEPREDLWLEVAHSGYGPLRSNSISLAQGEIRSELILVLTRAR